jgi:hypothetical protein
MRSGLGMEEVRSLFGNWKGAIELLRMGRCVLRSRSLRDRVLGV